MSYYWEPSIPPISRINTLMTSSPIGSEPYYVVGVDPLHATISHSTVQSLLIVGGVLLGLLILTLILVGIGVAHSNAVANPLPVALAPTHEATAQRQVPVFTTVSNPGASESGSYSTPVNCRAFQNPLTCQSEPTRVWNPHTSTVGSCECLAPFWSEDGSREAHNANY